MVALSPHPDEGSLSGADPLDEVGQGPQIVRPHHDVDLGKALQKPLAILLGQAPGHGQDQVGALGLQALEVAEATVDLLIGVVPDAAGIEDHHVGLVGG